MNKTAQQGRRNNAGVVIFIIILIIIIIVLWKTGVLGDWFSKLGSSSASIALNQVDRPDDVGAWCKQQEFSVGSDIINPESSFILGWDSVRGCCIQEFRGWDCALQKDVKLDYCYKTQIYNL